MKTLVKTILSVVFAGICLISPAQSGTSHSVGLQLNPFLDENFFNGNAFKPVYALRYTISIKDHITLGPEISGYNIRVPTIGPAYRSSSFNVGGFFRYSILPASRIRPFLELSPYYTFYSYKIKRPAETFSGTEPSGKSSYFSGYVAPGITLFNKSQKISLDVFYKFSGKDFLNGKQSVLSYRFNFRF
jgi:hypothetical protein